MKIKIKLLVIIATVLVFSACATKSLEELFAENQGLQQMTSERLEAALDGNTLQWNDGTIVYYNGSEIRTPEANSEITVGTINFANDLHCRSWNGGSDKCSTVYEDGSGTLTFFVDGKPDSSGGSGRIIAGNPEKL